MSCRLCAAMRSPLPARTRTRLERWEATLKLREQARTERRQAKREARQAARGQPATQGGQQ